MRDTLVLHDSDGSVVLGSVRNDVVHVVSRYAAALDNVMLFYDDDKILHMLSIRHFYKHLSLGLAVSTILYDYLCNTVAV
jgi:hypothetical protein